MKHNFLEFLLLVFHSNRNTNMYFSHLEERCSLVNSTWVTSISRWWNHMIYPCELDLIFSCDNPSTSRSTEDDRRLREREWIGDDPRACLSLAAPELTGSTLARQRWRASCKTAPQPPYIPDPLWDPCTGKWKQNIILVT